MYEEEVKIRINKETKTIHLALKITDNFVKNFSFTEQQFIKLLSPQTQKVSIPNWTFQKLSSFVKVYDDAYETHFRISNKQWKSVVQKTREALHE